ncbi:hypothetical protein NL676_003914 [Syzygium grande]|nr:hypothetical protein NL676_003914 [Syzygium grande]
MTEPRDMTAREAGDERVDIAPKLAKDDTEAGGGVDEGMEPQWKQVDESGDVEEEIRERRMECGCYRRSALGTEDWRAPGRWTRRWSGRRTRGERKRKTRLSPLWDSGSSNGFLERLSCLFIVSHAVKMQERRRRKVLNKERGSQHGGKNRGVDSGGVSLRRESSAERKSKVARDVLE